jgi:O-antigen ligase
MALLHDPSRLLLATGYLFGGLFLGLLAGLDPKLAILVSVACAYILVTFANLSVGLALFVFISFLEVLSIGGLAGSLTKLLGLVLALSWLALIATRADGRPDLFSAHPAVGYGLVLFVGWSALSGLWAESSSAATAVAFRFLLDAVLYVIVYTAVRDRRTAQMTIAAFVAGALAAAAYGLIASPALPGAEGRLTAGVFDPNQLAAVLVGGGILSLGLAGAWKRDPAASTLALCVSGFCLVAMFLTASRGGLIALAAAMVAAVIFGGRWRWLALVVSLLIAGGGLFYYTALAPQSARDRVTEVTQGQAGEQEGRATIWKVGWRMFEAEPIRGVGSGNFSQAALKFVVRPGEAPRSDRLVSEPAVAHNTYLETLAETGLVGGALLAGLIAFSVGSAAVAAKRFRQLGDRGMELLSRTLVIAMVGILVADFFISEQTSKQFWLVLGLGPAFLAIANRMSRSSDLEG